MKCDVLGKKLIHFTDDNNKEVRILQLFVNHRLPKSNEIFTTEGIGCSIVNCPYEYADDIHINTKIELDFDAKGKLLEIILDEE